MPEIVGTPRARQRSGLRTVQGVTRLNTLLGTNLTQADVRRNTIVRQFWTPDNPINSYPSNVDQDASNQLGVLFYQDASFIRLQDLSLSYEMPASWSGRSNSA